MFEGLCASRIDILADPSDLGWLVEEGSFNSYCGDGGEVLQFIWWVGGGVGVGVGGSPTLVKEL